MNEIIQLHWKTILIALGVTAIFVVIVFWLFKDPNLWTSLAAAVIIAIGAVWFFLTYDDAYLVLHKRGTAVVPPGQTEPASTRKFR